MNSNLYWLTGLSGAGKSTIAHLLYSYLRRKKNNVVYLDGDDLRKIFGTTNNYSPNERKVLALSYSRLCKMLTEQSIDVVIATISMFHEVRDWNRRNITNYKEIYIKVPMEVLIARDQKNLYSKGLTGEFKQIMGIDLEVEEPISPDLVIENDGTRTPENIVNQIIDKFALNNQTIC